MPRNSVMSAVPSVSHRTRLSRCLSAVALVTLGAPTAHALQLIEASDGVSMRAHMRLK
jgi:hypothetical protein